MRISGIIVLLLLVLLLPEYAEGQHRSKENLDRRIIRKRGVFPFLFHRRKDDKNTKNEFSENRNAAAKRSNSKIAAYPTQWNKNQRLEAEKIWLRQQKFRKQQRAKKREPTAWELAYLKQEKLLIKELEKLLKERNKRLAARTKVRSKAMAAAARYRRNKLKSAGNKSRRQAFSEVSIKPGAGNVYHKK